MQMVKTTRAGGEGMSEYIEGPVICLKGDWDTLEPLGKQFLTEAEAGAFRYGVTDCSVWAEGAPRTGNLFTMEVEESPLPDGGSLYTLKE